MSQQSPHKDDIMLQLDQKFSQAADSSFSKPRHLPIANPNKSNYVIFTKIEEEDDDPMHMHKSYNPAQFTSPLHSPRKSGNAAGGGKAAAAGMGFKQACLCSPTTHAGSFRCRLHRNGSQMKRGFSVGSNLADLAR